MPLLGFLRPQAPVGRASTDASANGLDAFSPESKATDADHGSAEPPRQPSKQWRGVVVASALAVTAIAVMGATGFSAYRTRASAAAAASLSVHSNPVDAQVTIDGKPAGSTPLSVTMAPGRHQVVLVSSTGQQRSLDVTLKAGESVVHQIEWAAPVTTPAATTGALSVQTEPSGQIVLVDDVRRGISPLTLSDLTAGTHVVVVSNDAGSVRRQIAITPGETTSLWITPTVTPRAEAVSAGWVKVNSPVLVQLRTGGNLIGNSENARVMLPAGEHEIELTNEALGFSARRRVTVTPGRVAEVRLAPPEGTVSINAVPWAEVWLDGERLGETPLANISRPIGTYNVVFRHPQFGERQTTVTVSLKGTTRLGVDMRQQ